MVTVTAEHLLLVRIIDLTDTRDLDDTADITECARLIFYLLVAPSRIGFARGVEH